MPRGIPDRITVVPDLAKLVCWRGSGDAEITSWPSPAEACQASRELSPCGSQCVFEHGIVFADERGRIRVVRPPITHNDRRRNDDDRSNPATAQERRL